MVELPPPRFPGQPRRLRASSGSVGASKRHGSRAKTVREFDPCPCPVPSSSFAPPCVAAPSCGTRCAACRRPSCRPRRRSRSAVSTIGQGSGGGRGLAPTRCSPCRGGRERSWSAGLATRRTRCRRRACALSPSRWRAPAARRIVSIRAHDRALAAVRLPAAGPDGVARGGPCPAHGTRARKADRRSRRGAGPVRRGGDAAGGGRQGPARRLEGPPRPDHPEDADGTLGADPPRARHSRLRAGRDRRPGRAAPPAVRPCRTSREGPPEGLPARRLS